MSKEGFYFCDLNFENVIVNKITFAVKCIDFEDYLFDISENAFMKNTNMGTVGYCSSESCQIGSYNLKPSLVFSIGCILYTCIEKIKNNPIIRPGVLMNR